MRKITIIDTFSTGHFHEVFNFCFLYSVLIGNKDATIFYHADSYVISLIINHAEKENVNLRRVVFKPIKIIKGEKSWNILLRLGIGCILNIYFRIKTKNSIIYSQLNPFFGFLYPFWKKSKKKTYIVCHGELEYLINTPPIYKPMYIYKKCLSLFFKYNFTDNLTLFVLGNSIKNNLLPHTITNNHTNLKVVRHPYIFINNIISQKSMNHPLRIGLVGSLSKHQVFESLLEISNHFEREISQNKIKFIIIGSNKLAPDLYPLLTFLRREHGNSYYLDYDELQDAINSLDYVMYLYPTNSYKLIASGAFFDAVNHKRPIIALENDYFLEFQNNYGSIGLLASDITGLKDKIYEAIQGNYDNGILQDIQNSFSNIRSDYSYRNISETIE